MATSPSFAATPTPVARSVPATLTAANTALDGTGATGRSLVFTAESTNGSVLPYLKFKALGTNVATVARIFRNNGSDPETASNNALISEVTLAATTASATAALAEYISVLNLVLGPSERIYVTLGTAVSAGWKVTPMNGGDF